MQLDFEHAQEYNGGSVWPDTHTLRGLHPETGDEVGTLTYSTPRRQVDKIKVDRLEVQPAHRGHGYGHQLMDALQRRHPRIPIEWWQRNQRPTGDMPRNGRYTAPTQRVFGPTYGLDHRLWHGDKLKPSVVADILGRFARFCRVHGYRDWKNWAKIVFFGSEASEWTSPVLEGNGDFDLSVGLHYARFRKANPTFRSVADQQIADLFTRQMHAELNDAQHHFPGVDGSFEQTWFANLRGWNISEIRPYAAYDVTAGSWIVTPPSLPTWSADRFPEGRGLAEEIRGISEMAEGILAMPEPYRTQNGAALWEFIHTNRSSAFGPQGEGWYDPRNLVEKALDQQGLMQPLWEIHQRARQYPESLNSPPDWTNTPTAV